MAESLGQATVDLIANTGGFEAGMDRAARKLQTVSKEAAYQGTQFEKLLGKLDPLRKAQNELADSQKKLAEGFKSGLINKDSYERFSGIIRDQAKALNEQVAAQKLAATTATSTGAALDKNARAMAANGQTLKQYQANLRGIPAQFTDIVTSLQGGQKPLTVFLQQGGQLKDMFGGAGNAAKALGGYVLGLINPVTLAAAAVAAVGVAYYQGSKEATAYNTALINTGNAAGASADSLGAMASRIAQHTGTIGAASEVLAQLAASGKIPVSSFEMITTAALGTAKATGQAASEIAANFIKIAEDPLKTTLELNKQMNYLTETVYSQITAFEAAGNKQAAATLAEEEYAKALESRSAKIIENLGLVESAWNIVGAAAKGAWDAFLSVGRTSPLEDQIKKAQATVDDLKSRGNLNNPIVASKYEAQQKSLTDLLVQYDEQKRRESSAAIASQQRKDGVEAAQYLDKIHQGFADKDTQRLADRTKYEQNLAKLRAGVARGSVQGDDPRLNAERIAADLDGIDAKYADKKTARVHAVKAFVEDAGAKELDQAKQVFAVLQAQSLTIGAQDGTTQKLGAAAQELVKWEQQIADIKTKGTLTAAQKSLLADESAITAQKQQNAALEAQNALREKAAASALKLVSLEQQLNAELENTRAGFDLQLAGVGLGDEARKRLQDDLKIQDEYNKKLEQLNRDYRKIQNPTAEDTKAYEDQNAAIKDALGRRLGIQHDYYDAEDAAQTHWQNGALQAINTYLEQVNNLASQTRSLVSTVLSGLEDAFVKMVTSGKLSFKSLTDSIIADLARIAAKTLIVQPLLSALTSGGGGVLGGVLGGGGTSSSGTSDGLGGLMNFGKTLYSAYSSITGVGSSIAEGYASGGISGAIQGGVGYYGNMLSSLGTTMSSGLESIVGAITGSTSSTIAANAATSAALQNAVTQGASTVGANIGVGGAAFQGSTAGASAAGSASTGLGSQAAALAPYLGPIAGLYMAFKSYGAISAGYDLKTKDFSDDNFGVKASAKILNTYEEGVKNLFGENSALSKALRIPVATLGGIMGALFGGGWQTKDRGIQLGVTGGALDANQFENQKKKGGLFGSNKKRTNLTALDPGLQKAIDDSYDGTISTVLGLFNSLNVELNAGVLDGLNIASTQISTQGKTSEAIQAELVTWFSNLGNAAIGAVDTALGGIGLGSQTVESLTALVNNLLSVNNVLSNLNVGMLGVSVSGAYMAEQLAAMAGGLDKFTAAGSAYYDKFFTDTEKANDVLKAVGAQFASIGVGLPATRQGFRDVVEALDVTTESGRQLFTTLIGLSGNAAAAYDILEKRAADAAQAQEAAAQAAQQAAAAAAQAAQQAAQAAQQAAMGSASAAFSKLQRSIAAQQKVVQDAYAQNAQALSDALSVANKSVSDLTGVANNLQSALSKLRSTSADAVAMLRSQAQATLQAALATARSGGSLVGFSGLEDALSTVSTVDETVYASLADFQVEQARTANTIEELNKLNGKQLTAVEKQAEAIQKQLDQSKAAYNLQIQQLDTQLAAGQAEIDALNGIDTSITAVAEAIKAMQAAIVAALSFMPSSGAGSAVANTPENNASLIDTLYQSVLGRDASDASDAAGKAAWAAALQSGALNYADAAQTIAEAALAFSSVGYTGDVSQSTINSSKAAAQKYLDSLQKHAKGTNSWDGGPALMGEFGPELVMPNGGATVYNAQNTSRLLSGNNGPSPAEVADVTEQKRKSDQRWDRLLRYTEYLEQGFINGFPTVQAGA